MKAFLLVCLAAAVYAEADPYMVYGHAGLYNPLVYGHHVAAPVVQTVASPVVYNANPVVYSHLPLAQRATVHQTPELKGPGGKVDAKTAVAGDLTSYTVYHKSKREAEADSEADPALLYRSAYAGVPLVNSAVYSPYTYNAYNPVYNTAYTTPYTYGYHAGLRVVKREAESEADPALLYRSAYTGYTGLPVVNSAVYSPYTYSAYRAPVVSSPLYSALGYRYY